MDDKEKDKEEKKTGLPLPSLKGSTKPGVPGGAPQIPSLKDATNPSTSRFKGFGLGGSTLSERLKSFKKKDLAFILAGLGVLLMAPLAEHFLMSPSNENGAFKEGWGFRDGVGGFGKGGSPYEPGITGLSPGNLVGGGSDVITPLNVRDPSALVLGPGATQQPPAGAVTPPPSEAPPKDDWKKTLKDAANAAGGAGGRPSLPVPKINFAGPALRGLGGGGGGGTGASYSLAPISAANVPNKAAGSNSLTNVRPVQGFKGAAGARGLTSGHPGNLEELKKNAGSQGTDFNRGGSAATALEQAANRAMGQGSDGQGGAGEQGRGGEDKGNKENQDKAAKSTGDSLDFLLRKSRLEKELDLEFKKREKREMFPIELQQKFIEKLAMAPADALAEFVKGAIKDAGVAAGASAIYKCPNGSKFKKDEVKPNCNTEENRKSPCILAKKDGQYTISVGGTQITGCYLDSGDADDSKGPPQTDPSVGGMNPGSSETVNKTFEEDCKALALWTQEKIAGGKSGVIYNDVQKAGSDYALAIRELVAASWGLSGARKTGTIPSCVSSNNDDYSQEVLLPGWNIQERLREIERTLIGKPDGALRRLTDVSILATAAHTQLVNIEDGQKADLEKKDADMSLALGVIDSATAVPTQEQKNEVKVAAEAIVSLTVEASAVKKLIDEMQVTYKAMTKTDSPVTSAKLANAKKELPALGDALKKVGSHIEAATAAGKRAQEFQKKFSGNKDLEGYYKQGEALNTKILQQSEQIDIITAQYEKFRRTNMLAAVENAKYNEINAVVKENGKTFEAILDDKDDKVNAKKLGVTARKISEKVGALSALPNGGVHFKGEFDTQMTQTQGSIRSVGAEISGYKKTNEFNANDIERRGIALGLGLNP
ncbi:MAG: hypothetical protein HY921_09310 [Elusimicrobia bacterium]|nr:hypothetical protein [Elusimicrobiota bacterium]